MDWENNSLEKSNFLICFEMEQVVQIHLAVLTIFRFFFEKTLKNKFAIEKHIHQLYSLKIDSKLITQHYITRKLFPCLTTPEKNVAESRKNPKIMLLKS